MSGRDRVAGVLARCRTSGSTPASWAMARASRKAASCSSVSGRSGSSATARWEKMPTTRSRPWSWYSMASPTRLSQASRVAPLRPSPVSTLRCTRAGPFLLAGGRDDAFQFPARAADVDAGGHGGGEVALRGVQPGQQGGLDAGGAQGQGLGNVGGAQPVGAGTERGAGDGDGAVAVGVGLDHRHHLGRRCHGRQAADIVPDGFEVDYCRAFLGVGRRSLRDGLEVTCCCWVSHLTILGVAAHGA